MNLNFSTPDWRSDDVVYASSYRFENTPEFKQCEGFVENAENPSQILGCDNVTLLTLEKFSTGTEASAECSFFGVSAPLLTIAKEMYDDNGVRKYGNYFEVVIWKHGMNVWRMVMDENKKVKYKLMMGIDHPFEEGKRHRISATVNGDMLEVRADDISARVYMEEVYDSFHLGINACEGICRFYEFNIEKSTVDPVKIGWTTD